MGHIAKQLVESVLRNRIWIEKPANTSDVKMTLQLSRPRACKKPFIRVGGEKDGGYIIPDVLHGVTWLVSPGVADTVNFDLAMAERGMKVILADASVDAPPVEHPNFTFWKKFVGTVDDSEFVRLETLAMSGGTTDGMLQMDIEGDEYIVLLDTPRTTLERFRVMIIEFHHLTNIFSNRYNRIIRATLQKLLLSHQIVHIHPNNVGPVIRRFGVEVPQVMEFTFLRNDYFEQDDRMLIFPHPLDRPCNPRRPDRVLPAIWQPLKTD